MPAGHCQRRFPGARFTATPFCGLRLPPDQAEPGGFMQEPLTPSAEPVPERERISSIDALRGFALLGILVMNITTFAMPGIFDFNPTAVGPMSGLNRTLWVLRFVLFDGKMRAIFSMLFGAGVILLTSRLERRDPARSADIFARRNLWLTLFGVLHGYFVWM